MSKKYNTEEPPILKVAEPDVAYNVQPSRHTRVGTMTSSLRPTSPNAHTPEEMHAILTERIHRAEAGEEEFVPNQVVFDSIRTKYGF